MLAACSTRNCVSEKYLVSPKHSIENSKKITQISVKALSSFTGMPLADVFIYSELWEDSQSTVQYFYFSLYVVHE